MISMKKALTSLTLTVALAAASQSCDEQKTKNAYTGTVVLTTDGRVPVGANGIAPGTYVSKGGIRCSFHTLRNMPAEGSTNHNNVYGPSGGGSNVIVTISKLDEFFETTHCGVWRKKV